MILLQDVLPDLKRPKLPTHRERNLEFEIEQLKQRLSHLEQWKNRHE